MKMISIWDFILWDTTHNIEKIGTTTPRKNVSRYVSQVLFCYIYTEKTYITLVITLTFFIYKLFYKIIVLFERKNKITYVRILAIRPWSNLDLGHGLIAGKSTF